MLIRALDAQRNCVTAAEAKSRQSLLRASLFHGVEERGQHPRAARANRMSKCDRAAIDVNALPIPAELLAIGDRLRGKRFVGFDQIVIADLRSGLFHQISNGLDRSEEKIFRIGRAGRIAGDASEYLEVVGVGVFLGDNHESSGAIIERRCIAGGGSAVLIGYGFPPESPPEPWHPSRT